MFMPSLSQIASHPAKITQAKGYKSKSAGSFQGALDRVFVNPVGWEFSGQPIGSGRQYLRIQSLTIPPANTNGKFYDAYCTVSGDDLMADVTALSDAIAAGVAAFRESTPECILSDELRPLYRNDHISFRLYHMTGGTNPSPVLVDQVVGKDVKTGKVTMKKITVPELAAMVERGQTVAVWGNFKTVPLTKNSTNTVLQGVSITCAVRPRKQLNVDDIDEEFLVGFEQDGETKNAEEEVAAAAPTSEEPPADYPTPDYPENDRKRDRDGDDEEEDE